MTNGSGASAADSGLDGAIFRRSFPASDFVPGVTPVPVSGKVIDAADISAVVDSALDGWFTTGPLRQGLRAQTGALCGRALRVAGELGFVGQPGGSQALTSPKLGERRLKPGDEVITVAAGFPTTVNPIIQNRLVPVFRRRDAAHVRDRCHPARGGPQREERRRS